MMGSGPVVTGLRHSYTNERSCVTGRSVYSRFIAASVRPCVCAPNLLVRVQRLACIERACTCATAAVSVCVPRSRARRQRNNGTSSSSRVRVARRAGGLYLVCLFVRVSYIHETVHAPGISEDGFQAPSGSRTACS